MITVAVLIAFDRTRVINSVVFSRAYRAGRQYRTHPGATVKLALATFLAASIAASAATVRVNTSISLALAQARDGDTVLVPGRVSFHEHVVIAKSVRLLGTNSPVIDADHSGTPLTLAAPDAEVDRVDGSQFRGRSRRLRFGHYDHGQARDRAGLPHRK